MSLSPKRRRSRRVVVVVGASSGIGRATAHAFAARGDDLVLAARSRESLEACAAECRPRGARVVAALGAAAALAVALGGPSRRSRSGGPRPR